MLWTERIGRTGRKKKKVATQLCSLKRSDCHLYERVRWRYTWLPPCWLLMGAVRNGGEHGVQLCCISFSKTEIREGGLSVLCRLSLCAHGISAECLKRMWKGHRSNRATLHVSTAKTHRHNTNTKKRPLVYLSLSLSWTCMLLTLPSERGGRGDGNSVYPTTLSRLRLHLLIGGRGKSCEGSTLSVWQKLLVTV